MKDSVKDAVEKVLKEEMGFGAGIELNDKQKDRLENRWKDIEKAIKYGFNEADKKFLKLSQKMEK